MLPAVFTNYYSGRRLSALLIFILIPCFLSPALHAGGGKITGADKSAAAALSKMMAQQQTPEDALACALNSPDCEIVPTPPILAHLLLGLVKPGQESMQQSALKVLKQKSSHFFHETIGIVRGSGRFNKSPEIQSLVGRVIGEFEEQQRSVLASSSDLGALADSDDDEMLVDTDSDSDPGEDVEDGLSVFFKSLFPKDGAHPPRDWHAVPVSGTIKTEQLAINGLLKHLELTGQLLNPGAKLRKYHKYAFAKWSIPELLDMLESSSSGAISFLDTLPIISKPDHSVAHKLRRLREINSLLRQKNAFPVIRSKESLMVLIAIHQARLEGVTGNDPKSRVINMLKMIWENDQKLNPFSVRLMGQWGGLYRILDQLQLHYSRDDAEQKRVLDLNLQAAEAILADVLGDINEPFTRTDLEYSKQILVEVAERINASGEYSVAPEQIYNLGAHGRMSLSDLYKSVSGNGWLDQPALNLLSVVLNQVQPGEEVVMNDDDLSAEDDQVTDDLDGEEPQKDVKTQLSDYISRLQDQDILNAMAYAFARKIHYMPTTLADLFKQTSESGAEGIGEVAMDTGVAGKGSSSALKPRSPVFVVKYKAGEVLGTSDFDMVKAVYPSAGNRQYRKAQIASHLGINTGFHELTYDQIMFKWLSGGYAKPTWGNLATAYKIWRFDDQFAMINSHLMAEEYQKQTGKTITEGFLKAPYKEDLLEAGMDGFDILKALADTGLGYPKLAEILIELFHGDPSKKLDDLKKYHTWVQARSKEAAIIFSLKKDLGDWLNGNHLGGATWLHLIRALRKFDTDGSLTAIADKIHDKVFVAY